MILKITQQLYNDIFGQYKAIVISNEKIIIETKNGEGSDRRFSLNVNQGSEITVDFMRQNLRERILINELIEVNDFLFTSYAKNPIKGAVAVITGGVKVLT